MKKKILLIEDDDVLRQNTFEILQLANYEVIAAENGKIGIEKALVFKPDVIVCDIIMPELDGYGVLQIVLRNIELQKVPFIFMTAVTNHKEVRKGMDLGASDYITKPFEESELLSAIESRLKRKEIFENPGSGRSSASIKKIKIDDLEEVFSQKEKFTFKKGASIYCTGNNSNYIFFIIKGEVKTLKNNEDGKELITSIFKKQEFFGFTSFIKNKPYDEDAVAIKNTTLYKITKREIYDLIKQNPQLAISFIDILTDNLEYVKTHLIHLAYDSVRKKTANTLLELLEKQKNNRVIEISRANLASLIGVAKETLIRTLTEFKDEKIIETNRNAIKIIDLKKLVAIR